MSGSGEYNSAYADPLYGLALSAASTRPRDLQLYGLPLALLAGKGLLGAGLGAGTSYLAEKLIPIENETAEEKVKKRNRSILTGAGVGVGTGLLGSIGLYSQLLDQQKKANWGLRMCDTVSVLAEKSSEISFMAKLADRGRDEKDKSQDRKNLGPLEHAYVADSVGGRAVQNVGRKLKDMHQDPDNPHRGPYDRFITMQGGLIEGLGERISRGSARMAESPLWRVLSAFDPTAVGQQEGIVGAFSGFGGGEDKAEGAKQRAAAAYTKFLKKYQEKFDPLAETTERETPFHINAQGALANRDSDIAGHAYMRNERPLHYWLNPLGKSGPLAEIGDRGARRIISAQASPESTAGRFGMGVGALTTLGMLPIFMGGEDAQQKLRASAVKNRLYAAESMPEPKEAGDIALKLQALLKQAASRCWSGYEPVPGKTPYSEDSCKPIGSKAKQKEKKAAGCGCGGQKCDNCGTSPCECNSGADPSRAVKIAAARLIIKAAGTRGLWDNVHAKRKRGERPAKPGEKDYPDSKSWNATVKAGAVDKLISMLATGHLKQAEGAWTRSEGKSESGGLNAKGRASLKAQGHDIKPPVTEDNPTGERAGRRASFCARMSGMKRKRTSAETARDPDSRINKSLRKWKC